VIGCVPDGEKVLEKEIASWLVEPALTYKLSPEWLVVRLIKSSREKVRRGAPSSSCWETSRKLRRLEGRSSLAGGTTDSVQESNHLPALRFGQLRPRRHSVAYNPVRQNPEEFSRRRLLHTIGSQAWTSLRAVGRLAMALGTMLLEELLPGGGGPGIVCKWVAPGSCLLGNSCEHHADRFVISRPWLLRQGPSIERQEKCCS